MKVRQDKREREKSSHNESQLLMSKRQFALTNMPCGLLSSTSPTRLGPLGQAMDFGVVE